MNMERLDFRFYNLDEIAKTTKTPRTSDHLKRDVTRKLDAWGYEYEWHNRKGVTILDLPSPASLRLKEIMTERLHISSQIQPVEFAYFILAFSVIPNFKSMPWPERIKVLHENEMVTKEESTVRHWSSLLIKSGNATHDRKGQLWHTYTENGVKYREWVSDEDTQYKEYSACRTEILESLEKNGVPKKTQWGTMVKALYREYGYYYYCPEICLNALGEEIDELFELVTLITQEQER